MDTIVETHADALPAIPLVELGDASPVALIDAEPERAADVLAVGRREYGGFLFGSGDRLSRRWLERCDNPYLGELDEVAARFGERGAYLLNLSYEWFCTTATGPDPTGRGSRMLRTLDWDLEGLGRNVVVAHQSGPAGRYYNVTWPGFVGVATAMAPGRFSAALNQAPLQGGGHSLVLDWLANRLGVWRSRGLPPVHLLRRVFDECRSYDDARTMLCEEPVCLPVFFILSGVGADEGCVIERYGSRSIVHDAPECVANHWLTPGLRGAPRGVESHKRRTLMDRLYQTTGGDFSWVVPPILNDATRLAVTANAAVGHLSVQGWEARNPATAVFSV